MTDRVNSLLVVLSEDVRIDDVQALVSAISQLRGVAGVSENVSDFNSTMAEVRAHEWWRDKLIALIRDRK